MVCPFAKAREQDIVKKQGYLGSRIQGVVFLGLVFKALKL
jgi:hypothetical protein